VVQRLVANGELINFPVDRNRRFVLPAVVAFLVLCAVASGCAFASRCCGLCRQRLAKTSTRKKRS